MAARYRDRIPWGPMVTKISAYIHLLKPHYQIQFIEVLFGVLLVGPSLTASLFLDLLILFVSSHLMLYGGLYTINDLRDIEEDRKNEHKKHRPLPSGRVQPIEAVAFALILILAALKTAYFFFGAGIFIVYLLLIVFNVLYTYVFKRIPFVELIGNVLTHPLRVVLGVLVAGGTIAYPILFAYLFFTFGFTCARRQILRLSQGSEQRVNMRYYTDRRMIILQAFSFVIIGIISFLDHETKQGWYALMIVLYIFFVFGIHFLPPVRKLFMKLYLR